MSDLLEQLPDGVLEVSLDGLVVRANERARHLLGGDPVGWELSRLWRSQGEAALSQGLWRRIDGGIANLEASVGHHSGLRLICLRDVKERLASVEELKRENKRLNAVLEVMRSLVCVFERREGELRIVRTNAALERLVAASAEQLFHDDGVLFGCVDVADRSWLRSSIARAVDGEAVAGDITLAGRLHEIVVEPLPDRTGALMMGRNISRERQILTVYQQAARRELDQFRLLAGSQAHDLGNTLTVLSTALDTIPDGMAHEAIVRAERSLADARHLVRDLLHLGRSNKDRVSRVEVGPVVRSVCQRISELAPPGIKVRAEVGVGSARVLIGAGALVRILTQLGANALRACGPTGEVVLRADQVDQSVIIEVEDDGVGIPRELLSELFKPIGNRKPDLGLALVRGLVHAAEGQITAQSSGESGTCMRLCFPLAQEPGTGPLPRQPADLPAKVLVVEDDEDVLASLRWLLTAKEAVVVSASDGSEALRLVDDPELGLVLLDLYLPGLPGLEVLARMRVRRPDLPIVVMSGFARHEEIQQCLDQGAAGFLSKPFRLREIREVLADWRPS